MKIMRILQQVHAGIASSSCNIKPPYLLMQRIDAMDQIHEDPPHVPGDLIGGRRMPDVLVEGHLPAVHLNIEVHGALDNPVLAIHLERGMGLDDGEAVGLDHVVHGVLVTEGGVHAGLVEVGAGDATLLRCVTWGIMRTNHNDIAMHLYSCIGVMMKTHLNQTHPLGCTFTIRAEGNGAEGSNRTHCYGIVCMVCVGTCDDLILC